MNQRLTAPRSKRGEDLGEKLPDIPARRWARTDARQQRILDAATEVFAARGFTAATMADIVDHSAAGIGSIYHHFGGKKELFLTMFGRLAADIDRRIEATADRVAALDRQLRSKRTPGRTSSRSGKRAHHNGTGFRRQPGRLRRVRRHSMLRGFRTPDVGARARRVAAGSPTDAHSHRRGGRGSAD